MKKTALQAAEAAAAILKRYFGRVRSRDIVKKGKNDFVSFVDKKSEKAILSVIKQAFPDHAVLMEEHGTLTGNSDFRWIVDPLDGTTNYVRHHPRFAVSIAVEKKGVLVFGLVRDVMFGETFTAEQGRGARLGNRRIHVSGTKEMKEALVLFGSPFRRTDYVKRFSRVFAEIQLAVSDHRREGSAALDLAYVAAGRAEAFYEAGLNPWDMAAGTLLVKEAGGWVGDFYGDNDDIFRPTLLATNKYLKKRFLEVFKGTKF